MFLSSSENKNALVKFIVAEWKKEYYRLTIGSKGGGRHKDDVTR